MIKLLTVTLFQCLKSRIVEFGGAVTNTTDTLRYPHLPGSAELQLGIFSFFDADSVLGFPILLFPAQGKKYITGIQEAWLVGNSQNSAK